MLDMEHNGRYDPHKGAGNGYYYADEQYNRQKRPRTVRRSTFWVVTVAVALVFCLLGGVGAHFLGNGLQNGSSMQLAQGGESGDTRPQGGVFTQDIADANGQPAAGEGNGPASEGLNMAAPAQQNYTQTTDMLQSCMSSIVGIYLESTAYNGIDALETTDVGSGSGVILTENGYIATNNHVINGATTAIKVYLQDGAKYEATVVGTDSKTDLAVLKIDASSLPAATLGSSGNTLVGEEVFAIGNPLGVLNSSVSSGIISGLDRVIEIDGISMTLMQTDAAVNPGNSGGGLFNSAGELIGIINSKTTGTAVEGLGFAIPIDAAKPVLSDLMDFGFVSGRPYIGVSMQNVSIYTGAGNGYGFGYPFMMPSYETRVMVLEVEKGSAADKCGIQPNDIILSFDGNDLNGQSELSALLYEYSAGDVVKLIVQRGNQTLELSLTLGERTSG